MSKSVFVSAEYACNPRSTLTPEWAPWGLRGALQGANCGSGMARATLACIPTDELTLLKAGSWNLHTYSCVSLCLCPCLSLCLCLCPCPCLSVSVSRVCACVCVCVTVRASASSKSQVPTSPSRHRRRRQPIIVPDDVEPRISRLTSRLSCLASCVRLRSTHTHTHTRTVRAGTPDACANRITTPLDRTSNEPAELQTHTHAHAHAQAPEPQASNSDPARRAEGPFQRAIYEGVLTICVIIMGNQVEFDI